jgi:bacillithiol biosynthesis deacetylase BshB1
MSLKLDILAFGAHPDDVELGCGGTIAKEIANGKKVGVIDLTRGELGTRGTDLTRKEEATEASKILKLSVRENLGFADGFFVNDKEHQLKIIELIRKYQPEIVLCNAIDDRHIDHPKGSNLVSNASFLSGLIKIETHCNGESQKPWRPKQVLHYIQWKHIEPDVVIDISEYMSVKEQAVYAYKTQFYNPESKEPNTPISSKNFTESIRYRAQDLGRLTGVEYAEGFTTEKYPLLDSLFQLK